MFSGTWELNKTKSNTDLIQGLTSHILKLLINDNVIKIEGETVLPDREPLTGVKTYLSNGGTSMTKNGDKVETISCSFSEDKDSFAITTRLTYPYRETVRKATRVQTFSLTDNGKTLIVNYNDSLPAGSQTPVDERNFNLVYDKK